jgi:hypothetical protein
LWRGTLAAAVIVAAGACRDGTTAPAAAPRDPIVDHVLNAVPLTSDMLVSAVGDTLVLSFTYTPRTGGIYTVGGFNRIYFPAYSVCDPARSGYGPAYWDRACTPLRTNLPIRVRAWRNAEGRAHVEFQPALRFVPGKDQSKWVRIFLQDADAFSEERGDDLVIAYCADDGAACIDEGLRDRTMRTETVEEFGVVWRRIKHFSGYNVTAGRGERQGAL